MSNKDIFAERERGIEEEYFLRKERELIAKLHEKLSDDSARAQMEEATGIHDTASPTGICGQAGTPPREAAISKLWHQFS